MGGTVKRKKYVAWKAIYAESDAGMSPASVAKNLGVSTSTVYRALKTRAEGTITPKQERKQLPALSIEICLPLTGAAEVKLRNGVGDLLGTVTLGDGGLSYRRPNQKSDGRQIGYATLDRLSQLGIT